MDVQELIKQPIIDELKWFRDEFESSLHHTNPLLDSVLKLVSSRTGKMMRPLLVLLSARLFSEVNQRTVHAACTFEFFHTASLLHDDVVDESDRRRGQESVHKAYSNKIAILVGDYILALCLKNSAASGLTELVSILSNSAMELSDGELIQINNISNESFSEANYFKIITKKTAALFAACAESGAMTVGATKQDCLNMKQFGEYIGICFQIRDDIFDYSNDKSIGKPTGNDMKEGKLTLPVLYALNSTNDEYMEKIAIKVRAGEATDDEISALVDFTKKNGGLEYAVEVMKSYADKAKQLLSTYSDDTVKTSLIAYVDYVVGRTL